MTAWMDKEAYHALIQRFLEKQIDGPTFGQSFRDLRERDTATAHARPGYAERRAAFIAAVNRREIRGRELQQCKADLDGFGQDMTFYDLIQAITHEADWLCASAPPDIETWGPATSPEQEAENARAIIRHLLSAYHLAQQQQRNITGRGDGREEVSI